jgi:hypothetical protein
VSFNVTSLGAHTVNVWMRESGIVLDKLVLSPGSSYAPSGTGPAAIFWGPDGTTTAATGVTASGW